MIPILYAANETVFTHNGIGLLADCIACEVTEERNGIYEAVIRYPITGIQYASILEGCLVKIKPNELSDPQLFRIYKTSKPINGIITINLEHISYILNGNPVAAYAVINAGATAAIDAALSNATFAHGFSAWSDITSAHSVAFDVPTSVRAILGGVEGSILDTWGGEYEFDNFIVKLHAARGTVTDIVIEYGKNLTDIKQERNIGNVYTALFPYAKYITKSTVNGVEVETEHLITLTEKTIAAPTAASYAHNKARIRDFSGDFERDTAITESALRGVATAYLAANPIDTPSVNITLSFVPLWQTAEYANIAPLERVKLCDTVTVRFTKLGVTATAKIIKTVYNCLLERYITIELGTAKSNFGQTINNVQNQINVLNTGIKTQTGALYQAILNATAAITGQTGGYVVLNPAENPQEILIMNTADIATATKVWRWNSGGFGYSSTGYNGTYDTAITMDGAIVADFITTGNLDAGLITTGALNADLITVGRLQSANADSHLNMWDGTFSFGNGALAWNGTNLAATGSFSTLAIDENDKEARLFMTAVEWDAGLIGAELTFTHDNDIKFSLCCEHYDFGAYGIFSRATLSVDGGTTLPNTLVLRADEINLDAADGIFPTNSIFFPNEYGIYGRSVGGAFPPYYHLLRMNANNNVMIGQYNTKTIIMGHETIEIVIDSNIVGYFDSTGWHNS